MRTYITIVLLLSLFRHTVTHSKKPNNVDVLTYSFAFFITFLIEGVAILFVWLI